jgi:hypothetical protein
MIALLPLLPLAGEGGAKRRMRVYFAEFGEKFGEGCVTEPTPSPTLSGNSPAGRRERGNDGREL